MRITNRLLILLIMSMPYLLFANDQIKDNLKCLSPHLNENTAKNYAIIIEEYSKEFDVGWEVVAVIFKQESDFDYKAVNYESRDFGIGQMNYINLIRRDIDLGKLLTDEHYAIKHTFKFLSELKEKYNTNSKGWRRWYTRYNSFRWSARRKYYKLLKRHFDKIEDCKNEQREQSKTRLKSKTQ